MASDINKISQGFIFKIKSDTDKQINVIEN